jgi:glycosyltransferase involved in cell wall biosynthesis
MTMRVLLVADMRDPHAINWASGLLDVGIDPVIVSSRRLLARERSSIPPAVAAHIVHEPDDPISAARSVLTQSRLTLKLMRRLNRGAPSTTSSTAPHPEGSGWLELPLELSIARRLSRRIERIAGETAPDLLHALRVPFEGIAAAGATTGLPLAVSLWGSDLSRQAPGHPRLAQATRAALAKVDGVHADCHRDIALAQKWGAKASAEAIVAAGNMGFDERVFCDRQVSRSQRLKVVFPRGVSPSVNYRGFLEAVSVLSERYPALAFVGVHLAGDPVAEDLRGRMSHPDRLQLTGRLTSEELADLFRHSIAVISPSVGDGTPNSVLEGMACGAVPVVGNIEPLRELLLPDFPRSLIDPLDSTAIVNATARLVEMSHEHWESESRKARELVLSRWSRSATASRIVRWYEVVHAKSHRDYR